MLSNLTLNSIFWLAVGVILVGWGGYAGYAWRMFPFMAGLVSLGIGSICCGLSNGFTDYSPMGRWLWKIGLPVLLLGLALTIYNLSKYI